MRCIHHSECPSLVSPVGIVKSEFFEMRYRPSPSIETRDSQTARIPEPRISFFCHYYKESSQYYFCSIHFVFKSHDYNVRLPIFQVIHFWAARDFDNFPSIHSFPSNLVIDLLFARKSDNIFETNLEKHCSDSEQPFLRTCSDVTSNMAATVGDVMDDVMCKYSIRYIFRSHPHFHCIGCAYPTRSLRYHVGCA
jgi:hypothetical protein